MPKGVFRDACQRAVDDPNLELLFHALDVRRGFETQDGHDTAGLSITALGVYNSIIERDGCNDYFIFYFSSMPLSQQSHPVLIYAGWSRLGCCSNWPVCWCWRGADCFMRRHGRCWH